MKTSSILGTAERLFKPLIREKLFKDYDELLKNLLIIYINQQIKTYQKQIQELEKKYQLSFDEFTRAPIRSRFKSLKKNISFLSMNSLEPSREKLHGRMRTIGWIGKMLYSS